MSFNAPEKVFAWFKLKLVLWFLRFRGSTMGLKVESLERVKKYLRASFGLEPSFYTDPHQRPNHYFPGLRARPWYDPDDFSWTKILENAHEIIQREFRLLPPECFQTQHQGLADAGEWDVYYLYYLGRRLEENCRRCPDVTKIIESLPEVTNTGLVYFSLLTQGAHIEPHCGPLNTRLRCHLGVVIPPDCQIRVGTETRSWQEGRCLVFDDSFEHEVWNYSDKTRAVLVVDFWHPDLTDAEISALQEIMKMSPAARRAAKAISKGTG